MFHKNCIDDWFKKDKTCPLCKLQIKVEDNNYKKDENSDIAENNFDRFNNMPEIERNDNIMYSNNNNNIRNKILNKKNKKVVKKAKKQKNEKYNKKSTKQTKNNSNSIKKKNLPKKFLNQKRSLSDEDITDSELFDSLSSLTDEEESSFEDEEEESSFEQYCFRNNNKNNRILYD